VADRVWGSGGWKGRESEGERGQRESEREHTSYTCARAYTYTVASAGKFAEFFRVLCFMRVLTETDKYTDIDTDTDTGTDTDTDIVTESDIDTHSPALKLESRYNTQCNKVQHSATQCNTVQHTAIHCNTQYNIQCNTLQHTLPTEFYRF